MRGKAISLAVIMTLCILVVGCGMRAPAAAPPPEAMERAADMGLVVPAEPPRQACLRRRLCPLRGRRTL